MRKLISLVGIVLVGLAGLNALIEANRECGCRPACWCKKPVLSHFRWVLPFEHDAVSPEWKSRMVAGDRI